MRLLKVCAIRDAPDEIFHNVGQVCGRHVAAMWRRAGGGVGTTGGRRRASDMRGRDARDSMRSACEERHAGGGVQAACAAAPRIKKVHRRKPWSLGERLRNLTPDFMDVRRRNCS
ncbi:hypothetical protein ACGYSV_28230, partial [Burkholderia pseudomallei]